MRRRTLEMVKAHDGNLMRNMRRRTLGRVNTDGVLVMKTLRYTA